MRLITAEEMGRRQCLSSLPFAWISATCILLGLSRPANAQIINGDFSIGTLNGWTSGGTFGTVSVDTGIGNPAPSALLDSKSHGSATLSQSFQLQTSQTEILSFDLLRQI